MPTPTPPPSATETPAKPGLHPRNRHRHGYDFAALAAADAELAGKLRPGPDGAPGIDYADPEAVRALNRALLAVDYGIAGWSLPAGALCPPVPGRADLIHHLADLLAEENGGTVPRGPQVRALDIGTGASLIYPLLGLAEYGWQFVGTDVDGAAISAATRLLAGNPEAAAAIVVRRQVAARHILTGILRGGEHFDVTLCNPPFYDSPAAAAAASGRKWRQLGKPPAGGGAPRNFGGSDGELWCPGGERAFVSQLIEESARIRRRCLWFSSLVSRAEHLRPLEAALAAQHPCATRVIEMRQGQKQSRLLAWTFLSRAERRQWRERRWRAGDAG